MQSAWTPEQRQVQGTPETIVDAVTRENLTYPAVIVIGHLTGD